MQIRGHGKTESHLGGKPGGGDVNNLCRAETWVQSKGQQAQTPDTDAKERSEAEREGVRRSPQPKTGDDGCEVKWSSRHQRGGWS